MVKRSKRYQKAAEAAPKAALSLKEAVDALQAMPKAAFDETVAEAVMNVPCGEGEQPNTVKLVLKKGYRQNGKIIRFAQVSVTG